MYAQYFLSWSSKRTVRRSFQVAEKLGAIDSKQPEGNISRRKYYALTPEAAILAASGKKVAKMVASSVQGENTTDVGVAAAQPDEKPVQLYAIAATTTDLSELVEKLKPFFPSHDVGLEMRVYRKWRNDHQRPITARGFVDWMLRAEPRLSPPKHKPPSAPIAREHEEQIDPEQHAQFLKQLEDRKARNAGKHAKKL